MSFKQNIYNLRTSRNMSQIELAKRIGSSQAAITNWERGVSIPHVKVLQKISQEFGVPVEELVSDNNDPDSEDLRIARAIQAREKLGLLFDKTQKMSDRDLDAMLAIASSIIRENYSD